MKQLHAIMRAVWARLLVGGLAVVACALAAHAQPSPLEYQVKASYLYNFIQFIAWPRAAFAADQKFNLCVAGAERFGASLDVFAGERVDGHEIVIRRLERDTSVRPARCHLLFIAAGAIEAASPEGLGEHGVLTVGEVPNFLDRGGVINLVEVRGRIRFEINQQAARQAGLVISSRILSLAVNKP
ncbi:MAG TPA: YfiR family protein [Burkholderiales bacterium]|nr:YfiR family protein [Burkholderiales bacterium]